MLAGERWISLLELTLWMMKSSSFVFPERTLLPIVVRYSWMFSTTISVGSPESICSNTYLRNGLTSNPPNHLYWLTATHSWTMRNTLAVSCQDPWFLPTSSYHLQPWQLHISFSEAGVIAGRFHQGRFQGVYTCHWQLSWILTRFEEPLTVQRRPSWQRQSRYHHIQPTRFVRRMNALGTIDDTSSPKLSASSLVCLRISRPLNVVKAASGRA